MLRNIGGSLSFVNGIEGIKNDSLYYIYYKDGADFTHFNYMKDEKGENLLYQEEMRNVSDPISHNDFSRTSSRTITSVSRMTIMTQSTRKFSEMVSHLVKVGIQNWMLINRNSGTKNKTT